MVLKVPQRKRKPSKKSEGQKFSACDRGAAKNRKSGWACSIYFWEINNWFNIKGTCLDGCLAASRTKHTRELNQKCKYELSKFVWISLILNLKPIAHWKLVHIIFPGTMENRLLKSTPPPISIPCCPFMLGMG